MINYLSTSQQSDLVHPLGKACLILKPTHISQVQHEQPQETPDEEKGYEGNVIRNEEAHEIWQAESHGPKIFAPLAQKGERNVPLRHCQ